MKVSEDTFKLANKNAKSNGLYFKKLADANTKDKADYDMWQVAQKDGYQVLYSFESGTSGKTLPNEVTSLLPKDSAKYFEGDTVTAIQPEKTEIVVSDGVWKFKGYDADSKVASDDNVNDEGHIQFKMCIRDRYKTLSWHLCKSFLDHRSYWYERGGIKCKMDR